MKKTQIVQITCLLFLAGALNLSAANGTWTNDASGNWSGAVNWLNGIVADASGSTADFSTINITANRTVTLDAAHTLTTLKFGDILPDSNWTLSGANTLTLAGTTPTINVLNQSATISSVIAGTAGLTKAGLGSLTLSGTTDTFTGGLKVNAGTLTLDYNASGSPSSTLVPSQALTLGGGALNLNGNAGTATSQIFAGATFNAGASAINAAPASGVNYPTLTLGAWTSVIGGAVMFNGPATTTYSGGNSVTPTSVAATATLTTTTVGPGAFGLVCGGTGFPTTGAYATVGLYDWASTDLAGGTAGTTPYTIIGGSQVTGFYSTTTFAANNLDVPAAGFALPSGTQNGHSLRFNTPSATANTPTVVSNPSGVNVGILGILVTPNMGAQNAAISGITWGVVYGSTGGKACALQLWQNNTLGFFNFAANFYNGRSSSPSVNSIVQNGPGTVVYSAVNTQTGPTWLNGGYSMIGADSAFGAPATAAAIYLNGGTVVASNSLALDNGSGLNPRPITLLGNGGGLAAVAGTTMTVDGQIGSAANTGPLVIGIPASAANGYVAGLLPGTGTGTANTTPVYGTGTVALNYASGTAGNFQYGGTLITGGATLNINSQYDLGGGDQGPTTFNGGILQYRSTLATGAAGSALDISGQPITFAGSATVDVNGHAIIFANSIGNGGSGSLTVADSTGGGNLTLQGANAYTGGTTVNNGVTLNVNNTSGSGTGSGLVTVNSGGTLGGTGTIAGGVTWQSGALALFTEGSPLTITGSVNLNGNALTVNIPGVTPLPIGTYTLLNASNGITGSFNSSTPAFTGALPAIGTVSTISTTSTNVLLVIASGGVQATWTNSVNGNWSGGTNWSSNPNVPHAAGDSATLGFGSALTTITLDANETIGGILMTNPNSFVIANAGNTLTFNNNGAGAVVAVSGGVTNSIQTAVSLSDNTTVTVASGDLLAISGIVSNSPAATKALTVNGAGTTILSGANSYGPAAGSVGTTLNGGGTLQVGNNSALGAGDLNVTASSTLQAGASSLNVGNNIDAGLGVTVTANNNGYNLTLGGTISGAGGLAEVGSGRVTLNGNNTYSGITILNAGVLSISSPHNVANTPSIILNGGDLLGNGTFAENNTIGIGANSGVSGSIGLIDAASGQTFTVNGVIGSAGNTGVNSLIVNSGGNAGTVLLAATNTLNGFTSISNGVLELASSLALGNSTLVDNTTNASVLFTNIAAATLGGLSGTNPAVNIGLTNVSGAALTLSLGNNNGSAAYAGNLSGIGGVNVIGTGTQTLSGATYSGNTLVYSGGLFLNGPSSLTSHLDISAQFGVANVAINGATLTSPNGLYITSPTGSSGTVYGNSATLSITNGAQVTANADGNGRAISYGNGNGRPGGNGFLTVGTAGDTTTLVTANGALDMFFTSGGSTVGNFSVNLNGGVLAVDNIQESSYGSQSGTFNFNGGLLRTLSNDVGGGFFPASPAQLTAVVNAGGAVIDANGFNITVANVLKHGTGSPDGGLTKLGAGYLTLSAANTYTGNTTISNGVLALSGSGAIVGTNIIVNGGATFDVSALGSWTLATGQTLSNKTSTAQLGGSIGTAAGTVALNYAAGTPAFNVSNGVFTVSSTTVFNVNVTGAALGLGSYKLISTNLDGSGTITVADSLPTVVTVGGAGLAGGTAPSLQINNGELYLSVVSAGPSGPGYLTNSITGNVLSLSWPAGQGWTLQVQTNSLSTGLGTNWVSLPGSSSQSSTNITIDPTLPTEFFRLVAP